MDPVFTSVRILNDPGEDSWKLSHSILTYFLFEEVQFKSSQGPLFVLPKEKCDTEIKRDKLHFLTDIVHTVKNRYPVFTLSEAVKKEDIKLWIELKV